MNCPYKRLNLEWRPLSGFEQEYEINNYGDVHILEKEMTDSRGHSYHREEQYKWIEDQYCYGGTTGLKKIMLFIINKINIMTKTSYQLKDIVYSVFVKYHESDGIKMDSILVTHLRTASWD